MKVGVDFDWLWHEYVESDNLKGMPHLNRLNAPSAGGGGEKAWWLFVVLLMTLWWIGFISCLGCISKENNMSSTR